MFLCYTSFTDLFLCYTSFTDYSRELTSVNSTLLQHLILTLKKGTIRIYDYHGRPALLEFEVYPYKCTIQKPMESHVREQVRRTKLVLAGFKPRASTLTPSAEQCVVHSACDCTSMVLESRSSQTVESKPSTLAKPSNR